MRRKDYEIIKNKDHIDQQIITKQYLRIANLLDEIVKYRNKIKFHGKESGNELEEILRESNFFHNIYRETNERFILGIHLYISIYTYILIFIINQLN